MKATDVMVTNVITVSPDADVREVARMLLEKRISAMPVVDATGKLVGIVSEGDLLRRAESGTGHERSWWLRLLMGRESLATEYVREHSRKVADVMTRNIISAGPDATVGDIAALLERNRIKRVPILDNGKVVGIVSRANLLQALATMGDKMTGQPVADSELRESVMGRLTSEPWVRASMINVTVTNGEVDLWGIVDSAAEKQALRVAVEVTPGVRAVNDNVIVRPVAVGS